MMSRLDDVEVFLRVVERGSFNGAAEQLGMPATSVSRKIKALEDRLGVQLLHRTTRKVWPSEAGQAYYRKCVDAMAALDHADAAIRALTQEPEGPLKVLITYAPAILILEPELATFRARYPKVQLHLTLDNHPLDLIEHGFDVGVRTGPVRDSSLSCAPPGPAEPVVDGEPVLSGPAGPANASLRPRGPRSHRHPKPSGAADLGPGRAVRPGVAEDHAAHGDQ